MNNEEIKEILNRLKKSYDFKDENFDNYITLYQLGMLLDYITNLQEENERLKIKCDFLIGKKMVELDKNAKQVEIKAIEQQDYKKRINKAIELLEEFKKNSKDVENKWAVEICELTKKSLQGSENK